MSVLPASSPSDDVCPVAPFPVFAAALSLHHDPALPFHSFPSNKQSWSQSIFHEVPTAGTHVPGAVLQAPRPQPTLLSLLLPSSDPKAKQLNGSKHKLTKAASLPGKNGNPTFAAVTAGYDKSPGECPHCRTCALRVAPALPVTDWGSIVAGGNGFAKVSSSKTDFSSSLGISHIPVDSDGSDRYGRPF